MPGPCPNTLAVRAPQFRWRCARSTSPFGKIASTSVTGAWARRLRMYCGLILTLLYPADDSSKRETGRNATSANIAAAKVSIPPCLASGQRVGVSSPETVGTCFGRSQCLPSLLVLIFPAVVFSAGCGRHHPNHPRPAVHVEDASRPYGRHWCVSLPLHMRRRTPAIVHVLPAASEWWQEAHGGQGCVPDHMVVRIAFFQSGECIFFLVPLLER